jgi:PHP domain
MATQNSVMKWAWRILPITFVCALLLLFYQKNQEIYLIALIMRFISFILLTGSFIFISILVTIFGPDKFTYKIEDWQDPKNQYHPENYDKSKWNILLDTHFHTLYSDGKMTIEQGIHWHIACGFNAFFVTDHNTVENLDEILKLQEKYKDQILVIPGVEIAGKLGHMNIIGLKEWDVEKFGKIDTEEEVKAVVIEAHKQGALTTWNHYPWSYGGEKPRIKYEPPREDVMSWGIDFIEVSNWDDDIDPIDNVSYEFCNKHPEIGVTVGTDVHHPTKDNLYAWTLVNTPEFTVEALMKELHNKKTDAAFIPGGIPYPTKHSQNPKYRKLKPIYDMGDVFIGIHKGADISNLDMGIIGIWISYLLGLFLFLELLLFLFI